MSVLGLRWLDIGQLYLAPLVVVGAKRVQYGEAMVVGEVAWVEHVADF